MDQGIAFLFITISAGISIVAFFMMVNILFRDFVIDIETRAEETPGRAFVLGLINTIFILVLSVALWSIGENTGAGVLVILGMILVTLLLIGVTFGLSGMVRLVGKGLKPDKEERTQMIWGGAVGVIACATPFVGWFLLLPYLISRGFGAFLITSVAAYRSRRSRGKADET